MNVDIKSFSNKLKGLVEHDFIGILLVLLGIILRLRQYLVNRSFWHDEANLALNLVTRTFGGLIQPLDYDQGAPIGFLFIEKTILLVLGNKDYILRIVPLLSGLLAVYLFYRIAREYFEAGRLFAILLFAISWPLISYSSELKQYSSDAMLTVLLVYLALRCLGENTRFKDFFRLGAAGFISIWLSHPSALVLAGIGLVLFFEKLFRKDMKPLLWTMGMGVSWAASFGMTYLVSLQHLVSDQSLGEYWKRGFMPFPIWLHQDWLARTYLSLLVTVTPSADRLHLLTSFSVLIILGIVSLLIRNRNLALLILFPFILALVASALHKYPLRGRFMLFLVPLLILLMAEGLGRIYMWFRSWNRNYAIVICFIAALAILWVPINGIYAKFLLPPMGDHIRPVLAYVQQRMQPDDIIYVYHGARPSFNYYAPFYNFTDDQVISGDDLSDVPALKQFYYQVDQLKGKGRVWVLFSHIVDCGDCSGDMETFYVQYISQYGGVEDQFTAPGASVYLYNLRQ